MIYYTADPHFGHSNIITLCSRPFSDVDQMNKTLVANWNARVQADDTVYILGDFAYKCEPDEVEAILQKLNGHKHLIVGNHDEWMDKIDAGDYFESVDTLTEINDNDRRCVLCHYPMLSWNHENKAYMIYGHVHSDAVSDLWPYTSRKLMLNVGVEFNNYMPVTLNELIANNARIAEEAGGDNLLRYKGFAGSAEVSVSDGCLYGKVLGIKDLVSYEGGTVEELEQDFHEMLDLYLEDEAEREAQRKDTLLY